MASISKEELDQLGAAERKKAMNCFIDETAFVAGMRRDTNDGIKKWIADGSIKLFIPLHSKYKKSTMSIFAKRRLALDQLDRIRRRNSRSSSDAREAVNWLDLITSESSAKSARIYLQGVKEAYDTWTEVEKYLVKNRTAVRVAHEQGTSDIAKEMQSRLNIQDNSDLNSITSSGSIGIRSKSPSSPRSLYSSTSASLLTNSPHKEEKAPAASQSTNECFKTRKLEDNVRIPLSLQGFYNHIVWRMNHKLSPEATSTYIILTNDKLKADIASQFGIEVMRVDRLRYVIDSNSGLRSSSEQARMEQKDTADDDVEEIVLRRTPRDSAGQKALGKVPDYDKFGKNFPSFRGRGRGRSRDELRNSTRGRGAPLFKSSPQRIEKPIDPDSFLRNTTNSKRGFGGRKKLWEPS